MLTGKDPLKTLGATMALKNNPNDVLRLAVSPNIFNHSLDSNIQL
jgi:hypothetical protein